MVLITHSSHISSKVYILVKFNVIQSVGFTNVNHLFESELYNTSSHRLWLEVLYSSASTTNQMFFDILYCEITSLTIRVSLFDFCLLERFSWKILTNVFSVYFQTCSPLVVFGMLPHEQKMSVLNFVVKKLPGCNDIVQSKERLIFHCGYRRFAACPIFSQVTYILD